jgi:hypothetical protein
VRGASSCAPAFGTLGRRGLLCALSALALGLGCAPPPVQAADPSVSYSTWIVSSDTVMLRFVVPSAEAERLTGSAIPVLTVGKLGDYVLEHTAVSASGRECPAIDQGYDLGRVDPVRAGPGLYGFEIFFRCGQPMRALVLEDHALFDRAPGHVDFARIEDGQRFTDQLFTASRQRVRIGDPARAPAAGLGAYLGLGIGHVLRDAGRLCFLLAALLAARRPRAALEILAGLAAGYALALAADGSGLIFSEPRMIEAFIGFLVALGAVAAVAPHLEQPVIAAAGFPLLLFALAIVAAALRAPRPALLLGGAALLSAGFLAAIRGDTARTVRSGTVRARVRGWVLTLPAAIFGFLDGFALPSLLAPLEVTGWGRARMSLGYDLGALIAEAVVLAAAAGALALGRGFVLDRPGKLTAVAAGAGPGRPPPRLALAEVLGAAIFAGLGTFWLVSRLHA